VEQREEALEKLERLAAEGKMQVVVDVRKGRFEEILEIMKSAGVGELIVEFVG
jgi:hypothetical protein